VDAILAVSGAMLAAFVVALINSWYLAAAAIVLLVLFGGGAWVILVARVDGRPSYEDQERPRQQPPPKTAPHGRR
jgi:hypothetical protein